MTINDNDNDSSKKYSMLMYSRWDYLVPLSVTVFVTFSLAAVLGREASHMGDCLLWFLGKFFGAYFDILALSLFLPLF